MANSIATGALSRTRGLSGAGWFSGTCCIWGDQQHPGVGVAAVDRGLGGRRGATADAVAVSRRPLRRAAGRRLGRPRQAVRAPAQPAAARVLAGADAVARAAAGCVLV